MQGASSIPERLAQLEIAVRSMSSVRVSCDAHLQWQHQFHQQTYQQHQHCGAGRSPLPEHLQYEVNVQQQVLSTSPVMQPRQLMLLPPPPHVQAENGSRATDQWLNLAFKTEGGSSSWQPLHVEASAVPDGLGRDRRSSGQPLLFSMSDDESSVTEACETFKAEDDIKTRVARQIAEGKAPGREIAGSMCCTEPVLEPGHEEAAFTNQYEPCKQSSCKPSPSLLC